jgi:hypothetical protein
MSLSEVPARKTFLEHADDVASTVAGPAMDLLASGADIAPRVIKALKPPKHVYREFTNETPTLLQLAYRVVEFFFKWHTNVIRNSQSYAEGAKEIIATIIKWPLIPLTCTNVGTKLQNLIAEKLIGNAVYVATFVALQIFHVVPYITISALLSGAYFLYLTSPVALITLIASSILLSQVYGIFYAAGEVKAVGDTIEETKDDLRKTLNEQIDHVKEHLDDGLGQVKTEVLGVRDFLQDEVSPTVFYACNAVVAGTAVLCYDDIFSGSLIRAAFKVGFAALAVTALNYGPERYRKLSKYLESRSLFAVGQQVGKLNQHVPQHV